MLLLRACSKADITLGCQLSRPLEYSSRLTLGTARQIAKRHQRDLARAISSIPDTCTNAPSSLTNTSPIGYHVFPLPLPYDVGLKLQERIVDARLQDKERIKSEEGTGQVGGCGDAASDGSRQGTRVARQDVILLLEHLPTYTTGRRDAPPPPSSSNPLGTYPLHPEERKVQNRGADFHFAKRGGQVTYHGPGQVVGYPIMDLNGAGGMDISTRCYVSHVQSLLHDYLTERQKLENILAPHPEGHVGVFGGIDTKLASIGIHLRHRITSHGFSLNVTSEPLAWFDLVLACGLADIKATSIASMLAKQGRGLDAEYLRVGQVATGLMPFFERKFGRKVRSIEELAGEGNVDRNGANTILGLCKDAEREAERALERDGPWRNKPDMNEDP